MNFDIDPRYRDDDWNPNRSLLLHFGHREYVLFIGWKIGSNFGGYTWSLKPGLGLG